jgi:hypothetical protein
MDFDFSKFPTRRAASRRVEASQPSALWNWLEIRKYTL